jgi:LPS-assembly lipoprotein
LYPMQLKIILIVLVMAVSLQGCGFKLRGPTPIPEQLSETHIMGLAEFHPLRIQLQKAFRSAGARIIKDPALATAVVRIKKNEFKRRVLSVDAQGRAAEYEITYQVEFEVLNNEGKVILPGQTISLVRDIRFDPNNVLAKDTEEQKLREDMIRFASQQMMRRINAGLKKAGTAS